jgi:hypothetical protein
MYAFDFFRPITYNTDVLSVVHSYNNGFFPYANPYVNFETPNFTYPNYYGSCFGMPTFNFTGNSNSTTTGVSGYYNFTGASSNNSLFNFGFCNVYNFTGPSSSVEDSSNSKIETTSKAQKVGMVNTEEKAHSVVSNPNKKEKIGKNLVANASKYLGYSENLGQSKLFSSSPEWCADFVTYVVKETYKEKGLPLPENFGNHRVEMLKQWGIENGKYLSLTDKSDKAQTIKDSVNIGDILILRENGASHTGLVVLIR